MEKKPLIVPLYYFLSREELHAVASAKKLSSKNKALNEVRSYKRDDQKGSEGPSFEKGAEVSVSQKRCPVPVRNMTQSLIKKPQAQHEKVPSNPTRSALRPFRYSPKSLF